MTDLNNVVYKKRVSEMNETELRSAWAESNEAVAEIGKEFNECDPNAYGEFEGIRYNKKDQLNEEIYDWYSTMGAISNAFKVFGIDIWAEKRNANQ